MNHGAHGIHGKNQVIDPALEINRITGEVVDSAYKIHKNLGPGLLESVYEEFMAFELNKRQTKFKRQCGFPVFYEGNKVDVGFRLDFLVEDQIILELKSVEKILPVHQAQIISYLKLSQNPVGLLINFRVANFKDAVKRFVI